MRQSARLTVSVCGIVAVCLTAGCARKYQRVEDSFAQPVNCASARADIEWLQGNKVDKATEAAEGVKFALPTTIILGAITGTAGAEYEVGTGEYNRKIDQQIANIKETCNLQ